MRFFLLSLPLLWIVLPEPLHAEERIAVIVSETSPVKDALSREELASIYRRKKLFWENSITIVPLNLPVTHPLRRSFSRTVLGESPEEMEAYWNTQYFHGISPPYVLASEEAVVEFVATTPGAVGYVNATAVNGRAHVLLYLPFSSEKQP